MDKEIIERIALETAKEFDAEYSEATIDAESVEFFTRFLARIDAERWKEAIWYIEKYMLEQIKEFEFAHVEVSNINRSGRRVPLVLSPTIPEGMVLDAYRYRFFKEHMHDIEFLSELGYDVTPDELDSGIDSAMLAAQGEQK